MTKIDSILKSRDITLPTKVRLVKAMVFPVVMYGCQSWTTKQAERRRIDAFELWCWRRFLRIPWTARRSNQSILREISPECSLEGQMLKLKLQYFTRRSCLLSEEREMGQPGIDKGDKGLLSCVTFTWAVEGALLWGFRVPWFWQGVVALGQHLSLVSYSSDKRIITLKMGKNRKYYTTE